MKIGPTSASVDFRKNWEKSAVNIWVYISGIWGAKPRGQVEPKFFLEEDIRDIFTCFKFGVDRFRGLASAEGQILSFPIDFDGRPYNSLTLPCERVMFSVHPPVRPPVCLSVCWCICDHIHCDNRKV